MSEDGAPALFTTDDTGNYVAYTPPDPPSFNETLPEEIRESEHLKDVKDGADLARYYVDLKSNYLQPPDSADGYEFENPQGFELDSDLFGKFKNIAFENGVNQKQFAELMALEVERDKTAKEKINNDKIAFQQESESALKAEWGDNYDAKVESAKKLLNHESVVDEPFKQFLEDTRFGDSPQVIKMFAKLSDLISEDVFKKPGSGDESPGRATGEDGRPILKFPSME